MNVPDSTRAARRRSWPTDLVKRFGNFIAVDHVSFRDRQAARSWASSARTAPASRPSSACCAACCGRAPAAPSSRASMWPAIPKACASTSATCRRNSRSIGDLTVEENLRFFGGIYRVPRAELAERMRFAIDMAGLAGREKALVATLAGRLEAAPGARLRHPAPSAHPVSRRADLRRRARVAPALLGPDPHARRPRA